MINKASRSEIREKKHRRLRHHLNGTAPTPRLAVFRSNKHIYAQIIDDTVGKTLVSASTLQKDVKAELENTDDVQAAAKVGAVIGKKLLRLVSRALFSTEVDISTTEKLKHWQMQQEKLD